MLYPRLVLLRELLQEDGVVLVSMGDDEVAHLRMLLDEIFGEQNFIAHICWQKRYVSNVTALFLSDMHDHIIVYAKDWRSAKVKKVERSEEQLKDYQNPDDDARGEWRAQDLSASKPYKAGTFKIKGPTGKTFEPPPNRYWRCNESQYEKWLADGRIWFGKDGTSRPMLKAFLAETEAGLTPNTWWSYQFAGHNKEATLELKALFDGNAPFDTPKPTRLIRRILDLFSDRNSIILDSFAGSGTTAHAVIQTNSNDGGSRQFILVQQPFDTKDDESANRNVARIARERMVRAIKREGSSASFTYVSLGEPLFGEYKDFGDTLPAYEDIAKYIFYTETSREFPGDNKTQNPAWDKKTGRVGEHAGRSYYLLYDPNERLDRGLDRAFLNDVASKDPNRELVVYCERIAVHQDELRKFHREHGKKIRPMLVPFNLK